MPDSKRKLLIVDDEPATRALMSQIFTALGHSVRSAEDGFSALFDMRLNTPDIILSDLNMPGMSGFELLSVVRRRFPAIPVIAMSGAFSGEGVQPGVAADAFYEKASGIAILVEAVQAIASQKDPPVGQSRAAAPIWIAKSGHDSAGSTFIVIGCPDCQRTFSHIVREAASPIHTTNCFYCHSSIDYAVVQSTNPASPQAFQRKSHAEHLNSATPP